MTLKCTFLFQQSTAVSDPTRPTHRIGGWSESWYYPGTSLTTFLGGPMQSWATFRAGMLALGCSIVGVRVQQVAPVGPSQSLIVAYPGTQSKEADVPQMALLCKVPALNATNIRRMILRGVPDVNVLEGEYLPDTAFSVAFNLFATALNAFQFRGRDLSQPRIPILSIDALGNVITINPHTFQVGQMVRILRSKTSDGDLIGGAFQVATIGPLNTNFKVLNWGGEATTGGTARQDAIVFLNIDFANIAIGRIITRRVGRPFAQFRGRRSRRTG